MVSVMVIGSEVFGSCVGEIDVSVRMENRRVWLCCGWNYFVISWEGKDDSRLSVEVRDGARYRILFWVLLACIKK